MKLFAAKLEHRRLKMRTRKLEQLESKMNERVFALSAKVHGIKEAGCEDDTTKTGTSKADALQRELAEKICAKVPGFSRAMDKFQKSWTAFQAVLDSLECDAKEVEGIWRRAKNKRRQLLVGEQELEQQASTRVRLLEDQERKSEAPTAEAVAAPRQEPVVVRGTGAKTAVGKISKLFPSSSKEPTYKLSVMECYTE